MLSTPTIIYKIKTLIDSIIKSNFADYHNVRLLLIIEVIKPRLNTILNQKSASMTLAIYGNKKHLSD